MALEGTYIPTKIQCVECEVVMDFIDYAYGHDCEA